MLRVGISRVHPVELVEYGLTILACPARCASVPPNEVVLLRGQRVNSKRVREETANCSVPSCTACAFRRNGPVLLAACLCRGGGDSTSAAAAHQTYVEHLRGRVKLQLQPQHDLHAPWHPPDDPTTGARAPRCSVLNSLARHTCIRGEEGGSVCVCRGDEAGSTLVFIFVHTPLSSLTDHPVTPCRSTPLLLCPPPQQQHSTLGPLGQKACVTCIPGTAP